MKQSVSPIFIEAVIPSNNGAAIFLKESEKTFVIYIDKDNGDALKMALEGRLHERPFTHQLMLNMLDGLGAEVERVVINDLEGTIYFARIILSMENEVARKIIELDARPSDAIVLAILCEKPLYASQTVIDKAEDMTAIYQKIINPKSEF